MIIRKIHINSFGQLTDREFEPHEGLNLIRGDNESGKSTIGMFLLYLFYGLEKTLREKYTGWDTGYLGGHAVITHEGEDYRIERENHGNRDTVHIVRLSDNTLCYKDKCPGQVFLGVPEELFARVAYVRQDGVREPGGASVLTAIENLLFSGDESISAEKAIAKLDSARTQILYKNKKGGELYRLQTEQQELEDALLRATQEQNEIISKEGTLSDWTRKLEQCKVDLQLSEDRFRLMQAISVCEKQDRLEALAQKVKESDEVQQALDRKNDSGGKLPDYLFINRLEELIKERQIYRRSCETAQAEFDETQSKEENVPERTRLIELCEKRGGLRAVQDTLARLEARAKKLRLLGYVFIWLVPLGLFLLHRAKCAKAEYDALCAELEIPEGADPLEILRNRMADADRLRDYRAALSARESNYRNQADQLEACERQIGMYLAEWGQSDADTALAHARDYVEQKEKLTESRREADRSRRELESALRNTDVQKAKGDLTRLMALGITPIAESEVKNAEMRRVYLQQQITSLQNGIHTIEVELATLRAQVRQPASLKEQLSILLCRSAQLQKKHDALTLAGERMAQAATSLRENISPRLSARAGTLMHRMTGGKYDTIGVSPTLGMQFTAQTGTGLHTDDISQLSAGTEDLAYISLRLALGDLVFSHRGVPLIFDESFSRLDDDRLQNVLHLLADAAMTDGRQIILLCSSHRDEAALGDRPFHKIEL